MSNAAPPPIAQDIAPRPTRRWRARLFQIYLVAATLAFAVLAYLAIQFDYFAIDLFITQRVQVFNAGWFNVLMNVISYPGYAPQAYVILGVVGLALFSVGLRWEAVMLAVAGGGGSLAGNLIKLLVQRPRPGADLVDVVEQLTSYSFPSIHVIMYVTFFGFVLFLIYTLPRPSRVRMVGLILLPAVIAAVGVSRIYLGNHWASDVVGGYLFGSLWLTLSIAIYRWGQPRFFARQPVAPSAQP